MRYHLWSSMYWVGTHLTGVSLFISFLPLPSNLECGQLHFFKQQADLDKKAKNTLGSWNILREKEWKTPHRTHSFYKWWSWGCAIILPKESPMQSWTKNDSFLPRSRINQNHITTESTNSKPQQSFWLSLRIIVCGILFIYSPPKLSKVAKQELKNNYTYFC